VARGFLAPNHAPAPTQGFLAPKWLPSSHFCARKGQRDPVERCPIPALGPRLSSRRSPSADDWSWEDHQVAHSAALLGRIGRKRRNRATTPGLQRLDVFDRRNPVSHGTHGTGQVDP
jgi:hypothetical protein